MKWPIRNQVLYPMLAVMSSVILCLSIVNAYLASSWIEQQMDAQAESLRKTLADSRFPFNDRVLEQMAGMSGAHYALIDAQGSLVATSQTSFRKIEANRWLSLQDTSTRRTQPIEWVGTSYYHRSFPVDRRPTGGRRMTLHLFFPAIAYAAAWRQAVYPPLVVGGMAMLFVVGVSRWVARRVTAPLARLPHHLARVAKGDFVPCEVPTRDDEIRELVLAINRMVAVLSCYEQEVRKRERLETLGRLGSSMAHQIRNAATGCRMAIDLHRQGLANGETDEEGLHLATQQLERIEDFLERFLQLGKRLTKSDREPNAADDISLLFHEVREPAHLAVVIDEAVRQVQPMITHLDVEFTVDLPAPTVRVPAPSDALEQALVNMLRNAIEAATQRALTRSSAAKKNAEHETIAVKTGRVRLECHTHKEWVDLQVWDNGAGPSPSLMDSLYEPFVSDKAEGAGLGLALVGWVAQAAGGKASWSRVEDQTCFTMQLPVSNNNEENR